LKNLLKCSFEVIVVPAWCRYFAFTTNETKWPAKLPGRVVRSGVAWSIWALENFQYSGLVPGRRRGGNGDGEDDDIVSHVNSGALHTLPEFQTPANSTFTVASFSWHLLEMEVLEVGKLLDS